MPSEFALPERIKLTQAGTVRAYFLRSILKVVMRNVCSRVSHFCPQIEGKGALLAVVLFAMFFGVAVPTAHAQVITNVLGFARTTDYAMEAEGVTSLMVVRKEGTRGAVQVEVELAKDASTNSIAGWPTTNVLVTLRDNQLSALVPVTIKDNTSTNVTQTNSFIKFSLVNPRVAPNEDPIFAPTVSTAFGKETINLVNDDNATTFTFGKFNNSGLEGTNVVVRVRLPKSPKDAGATGVSVKYKIDVIAATDCAPGASTATVGDDFDPDEQTLEFGDDDTSKDITIPLKGDSEPEFPEEFMITLSEAKGDPAYSLPNPAWCRVRIVNDAFAADAPVAAGSVDRTFNPENVPPSRLRNPGANGPVAAVMVDGQNNTYLAGAFSSVNATPRGGIARVDAQGAIDNQFRPTGANGAVSALQLYTGGPDDGKVLIGGSFNAVNGLPYKGVARLNPDGTADTTFKMGQGADDGPVYSLALEPLGSVLIGGAFANVNGISRGGIARLKPNGDVDTASFQGIDVNGPVFAILVDPLQVPSIQLAADVTNAVPPLSDQSGTLDANNGVLVLNYDTFEEADEFQVLVGNTIVYDKVLTNAFTVIQDPNTGETTTNWVTGRQTIPLAAAQGTSMNITIRVVPDPNQTSIAYKYDATIDAIGTGSITIAGDFTTVNGIPHGGIARFTPSGVLDANFTAKIGSGGDASINSLAHQSDGSIIVGGAFERFNNVVRGGITRLLPDGAQDLGFASGIGADQTIHSVSVDNSDNIYIGGEFTSFNGTPRNFVARLNSDGTLDTSFMDNALNQFAGFPSVSGLAADGVQGYVATVAVGSDNNVVVGGLFSQVGGGSTRTEIHPRQNFARLVGGSTPGPGNFDLIDSTLSWDENGGPIPVSFERKGGNLGAATGLITTFDGAAVAGLDYTATNATYQFAVTGKNPTIGDTDGVPLNIPILDDTIIEGNEDFFVDVIGVSGIINLGGEIIRPGVAFGKTAEAQVTIIENDTPQIFIGFAKPEFDVDEDDTVAQVEVYRTGDPNQLVAVDYQVRVATGPFAATTDDFRTATNTITFQPGQTNAFFTVTILDDELAEQDETVSLRLSRPNFGAKLDPNATAATLNIIDNDLVSGKVDFTSATYVVVEGQPYIDVQVRRAGGNVGLISVDYTTVDGTALNGEDYTKVTGTLTWNNQDISLRTIRIPIADNGEVEQDEQFSLQLLNPSAPGIIGNLHANPVVTIKDNDFYGDFAFSVADFYADEDGANAVIQVIRRNGSADTVSVDYATSAGTAIPGTDYTNVSGTLTFGPGETAKTFVVPVVDDTVADANRTVNLTLSNPVKATLGAQKTATLTILDNETLDIPAGDVEKDFAIGFGANARVNALWLQNDGPTNTTRKIILAGDFTDYDRTPRQHVARVDDDGLVDARYANGLTIDGSVKTVLGTTDGKLVIGGDFSMVDDIPASHIARLNATGRRDTLFDIGSGTDGSVNALGQTFIGTNQTSRIIVAGAFTVFNGVSRARIALVGEDAKVDTTFDPGVGPDLAVTAVAAQRDGKIIIGGLFNKISGVAHRGIARLNLDGTVDPSFNPTAAVSGTIRSIVIQTDDKIVIGGEFNTVNGVVSPGVARLNVDGTLDTSFNVVAGANGPVLSVALQADGKIVAGGDFTQFNNVGRPRITRLLPDGSLDLDINFGTGANGTIAAVASQYDRKIVIGGDFTDVNGFPRNRFARLFGGSVIGAGRIEFFLSDYLVDEAAGSAQLIVKRSGGTESAASVDYFSQAETASPGADYQDKSGTLNFGPGESVAVITIPILDDNIAEPVETALVTLSNVVGAAIGRQPIARVRIVSDDAVFSFSQTDYVANEGITGGQATIKVVREGDLSFPVTVTVTSSDGTAVSPDDYSSGSVQLPFTPGETAKTVSIPIVDDNKGEGDETVLLHLATSGGRALPGLANSVLVIEDNDFHPGFLTFQNPEIIVQETDGMVNFEIRRTSGAQGPATVRVDTQELTATEGVDYEGFHDTVNFADGQTSVTVQIMINDDESVEATETFAIALSNATGGALGTNPTLVVGIADDDLGPGSLDTSFANNAGADDVIYSMSLQADGKIAIGGDFLNFDGTNATRVARLTPEGMLDLSFSVGQGPDNTVFSVVAGNQGTITIGGAFRVFNSSDLLYYARVTTNGFVDTSMTGQPGFNTNILVLSRQSDSKVLVGGQFTIPSRHVGRVNLSGQFDVSFNTSAGANADVYDVRETADQKVIIGGAFTSVAGLQRGHVARLFSDGRVDPAFNTTVGANQNVWAVFPLTDGRVLIGGDFTSVNGQEANYLARLNSDGSLDTTFGKDNPTNTVTSPDGPVYAIALAPDGRIVAGGNFANVGGESRGNLVRLTANGTLDPDFDVAVSANDIVLDVEVQPDGKILLAGLFTEVNGFPRAHIARLNGKIPAIPTQITSTTITASDLQITFETKRGLNYEVRSTRDFISWTTEKVIPGTGSPEQVSVPLSDDHRFYAIVTVAP